MKHCILAFCVALLVGGVATAIDVRLLDGTVITAENYRVTGSYVMLELADGRNVAYDVGDVDLENLRAQETASQGAEADAEPQEAPETISGGRSLKSADAAADSDQATLVITDRDVKHIRGSGVLGDEEQEDADSSTSEAAAAEGQVQGSGVLLSNIRVNPMGEGQWQVQGTVVNRNPEPALNVTVKLQASGAGGAEPWSGELQVASYLAPDDSADFSHNFAMEVAEGSPSPQMRASVVWMRHETTRTPDYTKAGGVPHPSNLPVQVGGVTGADLRPTPIQ